MSPIGRVFIVLNLLLAGLFLGFAGTYLQRQDTYNDLYTKEKEGRTKDVGEKNAEIARLMTQINQMNVNLTALEQSRDTFKNDSLRLKDDNDAKERRFLSLEADVKSQASSFQAIKDTVAATFAQAKDMADKAIAAESARDAAVREKDTAVAERAAALQKIASLEEAGTAKDEQIAQLTREKGELDMLVSVAKVKGFLESMAVPPLSGTVVHKEGNLCTIQVSDNPTGAVIKPGTLFAIYDGTAYKGEARVTEADAEKNVAFCTLDIVRGEIKVGDKAATQTN